MKRPASFIVSATSAVIESLEDRKLFAITPHFSLGTTLTSSALKPDVLNVNSTGDSTVEQIKKLGIDSVRLYLSIPNGTSSLSVHNQEFLGNVLQLDSALSSAYGNRGFKIAVTFSPDEGGTLIPTGETLKRYLNNVLNYSKNGKSIRQVVDLWSIGNEINTYNYYPIGNTSSASDTQRLQHYIDNFLKPSIDALSGVDAELAAGSITYHAFPSSGIGSGTSFPLTYLAQNIPADYMKKLDYLDYHPYQSASQMPGLNAYVSRVGKQFITRLPTDTRRTVISTEWAADQQYYNQGSATPDPYPWSDETLRKWSEDNAAVFTNVRDTYETSFYYGLTVDNYTSTSTKSHGAAALATIQTNSSGVKFLRETNYFYGKFAAWKDGSISGVLFNDTDGDGKYEPTAGEKTVNGRVVFIDKDEDGVLDSNEPQGTSDSTGKYTLKYSLSPTATSTPIVFSGDYPVSITASGSTTAVSSVTTRVTAAASTLNLPLAEALAPTAPSGLTATAAAGAVSLSWSDNSNNENVFRIQRRLGSGSWETIGSVTANATTYTDSTVAGSTTYSYQIIADNNTGSSAASNTATIATLPVTNLSPTADTYVWALNPTTNYGTTATELNVKNGGSTSTNRYAFFKFDLSNLNGSVNSAVLQIYGKRNNIDDTGPLTFKVYDVPSTSWTETGVTYNNMPSLGSERGSFVSAAPNSSYALYQIDLTDYVKAQLGSNTTMAFAIAGATSGASAFLSIASKEAASNQPKLSLGLTAITAPSAPSGLSLSSVQSNSVTLAWTDNSNNETGFEVRRRQGAGSWVTLTTRSSNSTSYTDASVSPDQAYSYQIVAVNSAGSSAASNTLTVNTPAITPSAPSNLSATATPTSVTLTWTDNASNETSYSIERQLVGGSWETIATPASPLTTYTDNNVSEGSAYAYRVVAVNSAGASPASNEFTATTPISLPAAPTALTSSATSTSVSLTWTDNAPNEASERLERKIAGGTWATLAILPPGVQAYTDKDIVSNTTYVYRVFAVNSAGDSSASNESTVTTGAPVANVSTIVSADAWVNEAATTTNYGNFNILQAKKGSTTGTNREIYLRFDISGITSTATAATLTMEGFRSNSTDPNGFVLEARYINDTSWTELGTTWATKPSVGTTSLGQVVVTNT
ncbi:MAG TPA: DNRLRE domain-containing protein, partial [Tepidisphaeraceae bacterium]